jgi:hypothetical protein
VWIKSRANTTADPACNAVSDLVPQHVSEHVAPTLNGAQHLTIQHHGTSSNRPADAKATLQANIQPQQ